MYLNRLYTFSYFLILQFVVNWLGHMNKVRPLLSLSKMYFLKKKIHYCRVNNISLNAI